MRLAYIILGAIMLGFGAFAGYDLIAHSGFDRIQHPVLGNVGVLGPALAFAGLVFMKFQGRRFAQRTLGIVAGLGVVFQTVGLLPYVQPRLLAPTAGHAGVGMSEILTGLMILAGMAAFIVTLLAVLVARVENG